jgi:FMN reductase
MNRPHIVGIGGTLRSNSTSELALRYVLGVAAGRGASITLIPGPELRVDMYEPGCSQRSQGADHLVRQMALADGIVIVSPGYHGGISGLVKNALDYAEDLRDDPRPYFSGRAVGSIAVASGHQAAVTTLSALRNVVHALRGWPTPMGAALNSSEGPLFAADGSCQVERVAQMLAIIAEEVVEFASSQSRFCKAVAA